MLNKKQKINVEELKEALEELDEIDEEEIYVAS